MIMNNDYFLFLNPDVFITSESLINYVDYIISNDYKLAHYVFIEILLKANMIIQYGVFQLYMIFFCSFFIGGE